jgi:hypothetical protein
MRLPRTQVRAAPRFKAAGQFLSILFISEHRISIIGHSLSSWARCDLQRGAIESVT